MTYITRSRGTIPGQKDDLAGFENQVGWGNSEDNQQFRKTALLASTLVDQGAGTTGFLRAGLMLTYDTTNNEWKIYVSTDAAKNMGILAEPISVLGDDGSAVEKFEGIVLHPGAKVKSAALIYDAAASVPGGWTEDVAAAAIRSDLEEAFLLDDTFST